MPQDDFLHSLRVKIAGYGKENLTELLYVLAEGVSYISGLSRVRIYVEDLIDGALACVHAVGPEAAEIREVAFPMISQDSLVSRVFAGQYPAEFRRTVSDDESLDITMARQFGIAGSSCLPLVSRGKSIGVLCLDREAGDQEPGGQTKSRLADFLAVVADRLDEARSYHQQVQLARRLEESKKHEAAGLMVRSAVRLVEKLCWLRC